MWSNLHVSGQRPRLFKVLCLPIMLAISLTLHAPSSAAEPRPLGWDELVPLGWPDRDPLDGQDISTLSDDDPEAQRLFAILREYLDNAPVVTALNGLHVTIPGYVVPLTFKAGSRQVQEFLLVPFSGACIHVPPPASNQIILVNAGSSSAEFPFRLDAPVSVTGRLSIDHAASELGVSGYRLEAAVVTTYIN